MAKREKKGTKDDGSGEDRVVKIPSAAEAKDKVLVEGYDYTIEAGLFVFTAGYLKRRGYCCGSGCRNCPY